MITEKEHKDIEKSLRDFCNVYLIDLVDTGFVFDIIYIPNLYSIKLVIWKRKRLMANSFKWSEVKDNFLPFYEMLKYHYKIDYQIFNNQPKYLEFSDDRYYHDTEVNDNININKTDYIKIYINSKI